MTSGKFIEVLKARLLSKSAPAPVEAFKKNGQDFIVADDLPALVSGMNKITPDAPLDFDHVHAQISVRDAQLKNGFAKDAQITAIRQAYAYLGDRLISTAKPRAVLDPAKGPLIAVQLYILARKSLGGLHTDLNDQVLRPNGSAFEGLFAAGEVCGFGAGGYHGYNALEGTFLGGCLFSGRAVGRVV